MLPSPGTHRNVPEGASGGPIALTALAKMARLLRVVVVKVAELCV